MHVITEKRIGRPRKNGRAQLARWINGIDLSSATALLTSLR